MPNFDVLNQILQHQKGFRRSELWHSGPAGNTVFHRNGAV